MPELPTCVYIEAMEQRGRRARQVWPLRAVRADGSAYDCSVAGTKVYGGGGDWESEIALVRE